MKGEEEEERLAEEKLQQLQEFAAKESKAIKSSSSSSSSSSVQASVKSSWEQTGNLLVYTAAGVTASEKVKIMTGSRL